MWESSGAKGTIRWDSKGDGCKGEMVDPFNDEKPFHEISSNLILGGKG
jgi:hypothetical protein